MEYGADNLFKKLRSVIVVKPDYFSVNIGLNDWAKKWINNVDIAKAQAQHADMVAVLEQEGVACHVLNSLEGMTAQKNTRDIGAFSHKGALISTLAKEQRKGEEQELISFCKANGIPILNEEILHFEGGDLFFVDEEISLIGIGPRTQQESASAIQRLLKDRQLSFIEHSSSHHLDGIFNVIAKDLVVCHKGYLNETNLPFLEGKRVIELSDGDADMMCANFLLLEENKILADSGCKGFNEKLRKEGVTVIEVDVTEIKKDGGSIRCMTLPVLRR